MSVPDFNDPFNPYYDQFSINEADFTLPDWFDSYVPDTSNETDYQCVSVIGPSISKGATAWTLNGQWITIGIYRDEGRAPAQRPAITGLNWLRSGRTITIYDSTNKVQVGDSLNVTNVNIPIMTAVTVTRADFTSFDFIGQVLGGFSGTGASYQDNFITDFYETYRVFRLLPSFKLVSYATIQAIFTRTAPLPQTALKTLYNITTSQSVNVPPMTNDSTNFLLPTAPVQSAETQTVRFGQVFDSSGQPLALKYLPNGYPTYVNNVDSPTKNEQIFYNLPVNPAGDPRIYVYDYYGLDLNDASRGPTYADNNVTRNLTINGDLNNLAVNPATSYTSTLNDLFGNLAIGVQSNNALVVRKQVLPLALNSFNQPVKSPT